MGWPREEESLVIIPVPNEGCLLRIIGHDWCNIKVAFYSSIPYPPSLSNRTCTKNGHPQGHTGAQTQIKRRLPSRNTIQVVDCINRKKVTNKRLVQIKEGDTNKIDRAFSPTGS